MVKCVGSGSRLPGFKSQLCCILLCDLGLVTNLSGPQSSVYKEVRIKFFKICETVGTALDL